jgi:hypothetical protein
MSSEYMMLLAMAVCNTVIPKLIVTPAAHAQDSEQGLAKGAQEEIDVKSDGENGLRAEMNNGSPAIGKTRAWL